MSVRIHAIAKETNKTIKEVIELLAERGYEIKSASSTIDNITAQSLIEEFKKEAPEVAKKMGYMKGGMSKKMGYNKGGYCGADVPAERPIKKGK